MKFPAWVEINLDALTANIRFVRSVVGLERKICLVVKADAYGHGSVEVSRGAVEAGVDMLGVATLHEGIELRRAGLSAPILVLSPSLPSEIEELVLNELRPSVSSLEFARKLSRQSQRLARKSVFHVEIDTGMGRTGLDYESARETLKQMASLPSITLEGLYTHFPDADNPDLSFAEAQVSRFSKLFES
ncbi:MAG: alanine racemase, partial [Candidatus Eisenbacteria bacterium]